MLNSLSPTGFSITIRCGGGDVWSWQEETRSSSSVGCSHRRAESRWCQRDISRHVPGTMEEPGETQRLERSSGPRPEASILLVYTQLGLSASSSSWKPLVFVSTVAKVLPNPKLEGADELPEIRLTRTIFRGRDSAEMRRELPVRRPLQAALRRVAAEPQR